MKLIFLNAQKKKREFHKLIIKPNFLVVLNAENLVYFLFIFIIYLGMFFFDFLS